MTNSLATELDLTALAAKGWANRSDFPETEYARALEFYQAMRAHDGRLHQVRAQAAGRIEQWTGRVPRDVGSFGTRLNLETSDLDLGIGYPVEDRAALMAVLSLRAVRLPPATTRGGLSRP
jgi:hypothetical protein